MAMAGIRGYRRFLDSRMFWLSIFLFLGAVSGTVFCNRMSDEMKDVLGTYLSGILVSSELAAVDRYSLCVGVLKKRFVWILIGIFIYRASYPGIFFGIASFYLAFTASAAICILTMHAGASGILHFAGLVLPQGIFYVTAAYLLWIGIWKEDRQEERGRIGACLLLVLAGVLAEVFLNPEFSAWMFQTF